LFDLRQLLQCTSEKKRKKTQLISKIPYKINGACSNTILHFEFLFDLSYPWKKNMFLGG